MLYEVITRSRDKRIKEAQEILKKAGPIEEIGELDPKNQP